ncbi:dethiobiotin synthase [Nocardiopsis sp. TSRI0078]|uniref:dethiobiotin synthase n=1 Tax=unclassified Nocardiopsis TaxID=2649073 RepID=UPI00093909FD|nr:dethiobiotin synthase [Nocardiopsis sp. TSRI0078]OKI18942.1 dethiobiotin synthase [Nocardiopsis sp. TSRI0078]
MSVLVVTGTGTEVGKTVVTAAVAALARARGRRVAVLKPAQTGVGRAGHGDTDTVARLAPGVTTAELARYPDPLAPATAAARCGAAPVRAEEAADAVWRLAHAHDLVLVEGAGGLLVRLNAEGQTLADVAVLLSAPVLVVARPDLGTLNATALTAEALRTRGLSPAGVVVGSWPDRPDLAMRCNLADLPAMGAGPLAGVLPQGSGALAAPAFADAARRFLAPCLGGAWTGALTPERGPARPV